MPHADRMKKDLQSYYKIEASHRLPADRFWPDPEPLWQPPRSDQTNQRVSLFAVRSSD